MVNGACVARIFFNIFIFCFFGCFFLLLSETGRQHTDKNKNRMSAAASARSTCFYHISEGGEELVYGQQNCKSLPAVDQNCATAAAA